MTYNKSYTSFNKLSSETLTKNVKMVASICKNMIHEQFIRRKLSSTVNNNGNSWYDIVKLEDSGFQKYVQVMGVTPYYNRNTWNVPKNISESNVKNIFKADEIYIISLPTRKSKENYAHSTECSIVKVFRDRIDEKNNINEEGAFFIHREDHRHAYEVVRALTEEEIELFGKYPTSMYS